LTAFASIGDTGGMTGSCTLPLSPTSEMRDAGPDLLASLDRSAWLAIVSPDGENGGSHMANAQSTPAWKYPLHAASDMAVIVLGLLLATWPLILLFVVLKLVF
jgi:hypothetical protein